MRLICAFIGRIFIGFGGKAFYLNGESMFTLLFRPTLFLILLFGVPLNAHRIPADSNLQLKKTIFECKKLEDAVPKDRVSDPTATVRWLNYCVHSVDFRLGGLVALLKTFGIESIANVLYQSHGFATDPTQRFDRTERIFAALVDFGIDSPQGKAAINAINIKHDIVRANT